LVRLIEFGFPTDCAKPRYSLEFTVKALDDALQATALELGVARRGHEYANLARFRHGFPSAVASSRQNK
jgi:hypothetical protein